MTQRLSPYALASNPVQPLIELAHTVQGRLDPTLVHLVEIRASQINGCTVCLDMHSRDARKQGESDERIIMLDAWRETTLYSPRERAALAWTESLTRVADTHAPDADYEQIAAQFTPEEQVNLSLMIGVINVFNRLGVGFRVPPIVVGRKAA